MNELRITMTQNQIALMLEILQPYTELSLSLTNQYKAQMAGATEIPHAKKLEEQEKK